MPAAVLCPLSPRLHGKLCGSQLEKDILQDAFSNSWMLVPRREDQVLRWPGRSCRTPSSAGPHQAAQPQLECSAVASLCCWPGRAGGRDQLCSNWTGIYDSQSLCPAGCKHKTSLNWCTQLGQACCQNRIALLFEASKVQGQSNYSILLLGEAAPRQPCWVTATVPYPPDAQPASLHSLLSNPPEQLHQVPLTTQLSFPSSSEHSQEGKQSTPKYRLWLYGAINAFLW